MVANLKLDNIPMRRKSFVEKTGSFNISTEDGSDTLSPTDLQNKKQLHLAALQTQHTSYKNSVFFLNTSQKITILRKTNTLPDKL